MRDLDVGLFETFCKHHKETDWTREKVKVIRYFYSPNKWKSIEQLKWQSLNSLSIFFNGPPQDVEDVGGEDWLIRMRDPHIRYLGKLWNTKTLNQAKKVFRTTPLTYTTHGITVTRYVNEEDPRLWHGEIKAHYHHSEVTKTTHYNSGHEIGPATFTYSNGLVIKSDLSRGKFPIGWADAEKPGGIKAGGHYGPNGIYGKGYLITKKGEKMDVFWKDGRVAVVYMGSTIIEIDEKGCQKKRKMIANDKRRLPGESRKKKKRIV